MNSTANADTPIRRLDAAAQRRECKSTSRLSVVLPGRSFDAFDGDDDASMAANNSSSFNFRAIAGSDVLSHHAHGVAIDVNPRLNPMILRGVVHPPSGAAYLDRADVRPGMIVRPGPVVAAFEAEGFHARDS